MDKAILIHFSQSLNTGAETISVPHISHLHSQVKRNMIFKHTTYYCLQVCYYIKETVAAPRSVIINILLHTGLQKQRLQALEEEYDDELEIIREEFDSERAMLIEMHNKEMNDIADILFAMEQNCNDRENDAKAEFQSMRDEIKNKVGYCSMLYKQSLYSAFNISASISLCLLLYHGTVKLL